VVWRPRETDRDETLETQTAADTIVPRLSAPVWILQHLRPNVTQSIAVRYSQGPLSYFIHQRVIKKKIKKKQYTINTKIQSIYKIIMVRYSQTLTLTRTLTLTFAMTDFGYSAPWQ